MTPNQIKVATIRELILFYKEKARCFHSRYIAGTVYNELSHRLGNAKLRNVQIALFHMEHGEGDAEFNFECDNLLLQYP